MQKPRSGNSVKYRDMQAQRPSSTYRLVRFFVDLSAAIIGCLVIAVIMEILRVSGEFNVVKVVSSVGSMIVGQVLSFASLFLLNRPYKHKIFVTSLTISIGLIFWLLVHIVLGIYYDWRYISEVPGFSFGRHFEVTVAVLPALPFFLVVILATVLSGRYLATLLSQKGFGQDFNS